MTLLAWQRAGRPEGPAVVLLHDWAASARTWERHGWVDALAGRCDVLAVDLPGHADSADLLPPLGSDAARWSAELLELDLVRSLHLAGGAVVAHEGAGPVAAHLAARAPELVNRLILLGCSYPDEREGAADAAAGLRDSSARVWRTEATDLIARARSGGHDREGLARWLESARWPAPPRLGALRQPVLIAIGRDDPRRAEMPSLAQRFHDAHLVTVAASRDDLLDSPALPGTVLEWLYA